MTKAHHGSKTSYLVRTSCNSPLTSFATFLVLGVVLGQEDGWQTTGEILEMHD